MRDGKKPVLMMNCPTTRFIQNLKRFRLITFDITETLLRFRRPPSLEYARIAAQFGIKNIDPQRLEQCFGQEFRALSHQHPNFGCNSKDVNWCDWWHILVQNIFRCTNPEINENTVRPLAERLIQIYRTKECWCHMEGCQEMLQRIKWTHKIIGVISNFDPSLPLVLKEMEILDYFDFVVTSYEAGFQKPHKNIYCIPLQRFAVEPCEALHIGNLYELDYVGARQAGYSSLLVTNNCEELKKADENHAFYDLHEILTALDTKEIKW